MALKKVKFNSKIHTRGIRIKQLISSVLKFLPSSYNANDLIVFAFHNTPEHCIDNFEDQVQKIKSKFDFLDPKDLDDYYKGKYVSTKPLALLTFDDGIKSNLFAISILNKYKIKGLFFIVPMFVEAEDQETFLFSNIYPNPNREIFEAKDDRQAMNWEELRNVINDGHSLGVHSLTHLLRANSDSAMATKEIVDSRELMELRLNMKGFNTFCGPVNSLLSIGVTEMKLIQKNYDYFFSTFPGINTNQTSPFCIYRTNLESFWPTNILSYVLSKIEKNRFKPQKLKFQKIMEQSVQELTH